MSKSAISRRAKKAGIPIRPPGGPSHAIAVAVAGYEVLRPAIESVAGFHRLKILATTARHNTYESAAAALQLGLNDLYSILIEAEADLGLHLLDRIGSTTKVRLAPHGRDAVVAMQSLLATRPA
ncbi:hypothetical protein [Nocardia farcinica]|uniref:hypothetical protein n=1 Tax=Nocardia farcinica TaxID=37329 RepID=UPI00059F4FF1|nr:hypothetical protein [Nocardia farcinica]MBF6410883.1 hypothetical protein [Nocardia farcinica]UEX26128.1 hypothetical protein LMJ57_29525 [Nocardia farcinica]